MPQDLTFATMRDWLAQADALAASGRVDLAGVTRVDSAGASFLLEVTRRAVKRGGKVEFVNASPQLRGLLEFLQIDSVLKLA